MADKTVIVLQPVSLAWLEERGAESRRGRSPQNPSVMLEMYLRHFRALLASADPRRSGLPEGAVGAALDLLEEPASLSPYEVQKLPEYLSHHPRFSEVAAAHGFGPAELRNALDGLSYSECLWLLDRGLLHRAAQQRGELPIAPVLR